MQVARCFGHWILGWDTFVFNGSPIFYDFQKAVRDEIHEQPDNNIIQLTIRRKRNSNKKCCVTQWTVGHWRYHVCRTHIHRIVLHNHKSEKHKFNVDNMSLNAYSSGQSSLGFSGSVLQRAEARFVVVATSAIGCSMNRQLRYRMTVFLRQSELESSKSCKIHYLENINGEW